MAFNTLNTLGINYSTVFTPATSGYTYGQQPPFAVGTVSVGTDGSEWLYVVAGEAITQYMTVAVDENGEANKVTTALAAAGQTIASAQVALAEGDYGWVCTKAMGGINVLVAASCAADVQLYTTGTAGVLDDTSAGVNLIRGMVIVAAATNTQSARQGIMQNVSGTATP